MKETHLIKIGFPTGPNITFGMRENAMNVGIQKQIDSFTEKGYAVLEKIPILKTTTHATVRFVVQKRSK
jgi:hypothetical protein